MFSNNAGGIPKGLHEALQDDQDWRSSGQPPRIIWVVYKMARDPLSHRRLDRPRMVKMLEEYDIDDPCPISQEEWARQNPEKARQVAKRKKSAEERRKTKELLERHTV